MWSTLEQNGMYCKLEIFFKNIGIILNILWINNRKDLHYYYKIREEG